MVLNRIAVVATLFAVASFSSSKEHPAARFREPHGIPTLWHDPGRVERLDFAGGIGGRHGAPRAPLRFVEADSSGTNPKVRVKDAAGREWQIKWGDEVFPDTFASRIAWAAGYYVEPAYYVAKGRILGAHSLGRVRKFVDNEGYFEKARFQLRSGYPRYIKGLNWEWDKNPFVGTHELNGLKIIMMLTSNWDNKDMRDFAERGTNTAIFQDSPRRQHLLYEVTDWGASMGKWGSVVTRSKADCTGYQKQTPEFVKGIKKGKVRWGYQGQHTDDETYGIRVEDVQWLMRYVGRITDRQLRVGLRSSGAESAETACYVRAIRIRIDQLRTVGRIDGRR